MDRKSSNFAIPLCVLFTYGLPSMYFLRYPTSDEDISTPMKEKRLSYHAPNVHPHIFATLQLTKTFL